MTELVALLSLFAAVLSEETRHPARRSGAGVLVTDGKRMLLLLRSEGVNEPSTWGIPGGGVESGEPALAAALREVVEEIGILPRPGVLAGRRTVRSFTTFVWLVDPSELDAFRPKLNWEHDDYVIVTIGQALSMELHPGLRELLERPVPGVGGRSPWPMRRDMDHLAASMRDRMVSDLVAREKELANSGLEGNFDPREDFDYDHFFGSWASTNPKLRYFGCGTDRAAFLTSRGVLKIAYGGGGPEQNLAEALVWKEAPPHIRRRLVPVLDVAVDGEWLLAERADVLFDWDRIDPSFLHEMEAAGLSDIVPGNVTTDGRLLDYGSVEWDKWEKLVPSTKAKAFW